ncbi:MAG: TldD/PmbA family protein [Candidatus Aminicenantes bacterium]|nr:TldD/PmbA family protein [Candidatus Aminicenantes bacterium]
MNDNILNRELNDLAEWAVSYGLKYGADEVEVTVIDSREFEVRVRLGEIEQLIEAGSRSLGFRLLCDRKTASASSSDLNKDTLKHLIRNAVVRARLGHHDEFAGLPEKAEFPVDPESLQLYDPFFVTLDPKEKIQLALETERIALSDKRITNSHGAGFENREILGTLASSNGFIQQYRETYGHLSVGLQAEESGQVVEDGWGHGNRFFKEMESPEEIARKAMSRTIRLLNPRKIKTQNVPIIFEPEMTSWLLGFLFSCIAGTSVYRKTTFLADRLGDRIADPRFTVYDHALLPKKPGSIPFDSEGIPGRNKTVVDRGVLKHFLCDTYAARKLGLESTGNADGGGVGPTNFFLENGPTDPADIIKATDKGLILTRTIGHGLNPVTGDISRGAVGLWVERGEIAYPVSEITIAGNLGGILEDIDSVGNDLDFSHSVCGPTLKIGEMTIAGE